MTIIEARPIGLAGFRRTCGAEGQLRDHFVRKLVDIPVAGHPTRLLVRVPRFQCAHAECEQKALQQRLNAAEPGAKTSRRCIRRIL